MKHKPSHAGHPVAHPNTLPALWRYLKVLMRQSALCFLILFCGMFYAHYVVMLPAIAFWYWRVNLAAQAFVQATRFEESAH